MNKGFIYGTAIALALAGPGAALAKSKPASTSGFIKGTYNCQLTGGFIAQPYSTALTQFSVDGEGNVSGSAGELAVTAGGSGIPNPNNTNADFLNPSQYSFQTCDYVPSEGTYTLNANGTGTMTIDWTASTDNTDTPLDCTEDITAHYNVLVDSPASFVLNSTDLLPLSGTCGDPDVNYAVCGSSLTGTCQLQSAKP
ncbi:MAG TPA: hypothetical protein VMU41_09895 [Candidatus Binataceae bacterium]|nr:hypothetical protein [Candidatus Binataceae bacterium]